MQGFRHQLVFLHTLFRNDLVVTVLTGGKIQQYILDHGKESLPLLNQFQFHPKKILESLLGGLLGQG